MGKKQVLKENNYSWEQVEKIALLQKQYSAFCELYIDSSNPNGSVSFQHLANITDYGELIHESRNFPMIKGESYTWTFHRFAYCKIVKT